MEFYKYKVSYWDEFANANIDTEGVVIADSYAEAAAKVVDYYGEDDINSFSIEFKDTGSVYEFEKE